MLAKNFPSKMINLELFLTMSKFHDVHMCHSSVRELGLPKTEIKVKNNYTFQGKFTWQYKHQIFFAMILDKTSTKHCLFKISLTFVHK